MFEFLHNSITNEKKIPATESVNDDPSLAQTVTITTDNTSNTPPTRFGSTRILLPKDPDQSIITIAERPNEYNANDYTVFISSNIRPTGTYYSELLTLLRTLTAQSKVYIFIGSPGGSLHTGAMIAGAIKACRAEVTTIAIGIVASSAALIWSYGVAADNTPVAKYLGELKLLI